MRSHTRLSQGAHKYSPQGSTQSGNSKVGKLPGFISQAGFYVLQIAVRVVKIRPQAVNKTTPSVAASIDGPKATSEDLPARFSEIKTTEKMPPSTKPKAPP